MKRKPKRGGTRDAGLAFNIPPFKFEGSKSPSLSPLLDVAESRARSREHAATHFARLSTHIAPGEGEFASVRWEHSARRALAKDRARIERQQTAFWQELRGLAGEDAARVEGTARNEAIEKIDILLARLQVKKPESVTAAQLFCVVDHALAGLQGLAAGGNANAAVFLMNALTLAVERFERLADAKPKLFEAKARAMFGIPAIVSRNTEKTEKNQQLAAKLHAGEDYPLAILPTGKRPWRHTPANALAERLVQYIWQSRELYLFRVRFEAEIWDVEKIPAWLAAALKLKPFGPGTWKGWAEVAWEVLAEISPHGKPEENDAFYKTETQICEVRLKRGGYSASDAPSVAKEDIRETLLGAFELIATGISQRTRQRQKAQKKKRKGSPDN
jgi:hypothetical protein